MRHRLKRAGAMAAMLLALGAPLGAAQAQTDPDLTSKLLIAILVKKGVLSQADAASILQEAQAAASAAQASAAAPAAATPTSTVEVSSSESADGTIHVTYIPPIVRQQIASSVQQQITAQQQAQGYSGYPEVPEWVNRIHFYGDFRMRYEDDLFPRGNDPELFNFNAINTGSPFDTSRANPEFEPRFDSTEDRSRLEIRARFGATFDLSDDVKIGIRLATGQSDTPVSENQTLGNANNAQGGNFSKYDIWLDRAYLAYTPRITPDLDLTLKAGRFDNPFFSSNLIWADEIAFDGLMASGSYDFGNGLQPFLTAGIFPVENTLFNFDSSIAAQNFSSHDKYLYAAQAGSSYKFNDDYAAKFGVAGYFFSNVAGKVSTPCYVYSAADTCDTDEYRPSFAQNGNTYMELRDIVPTFGQGGNADNTTLQYQYYGLASGFDELALTGEFDVDNFDPTAIWLDGEYVRNLAFNKNAINGKAVNNRGPLSTANPAGVFDGGGQGFYVNANVGSKTLTERWDWNAIFGYKYIESDAVIDAFNDSDFGLGGTNLKGYVVGGNLALSSDVWVRLRYLSADSIAGAPYKADVFQFDLNGKF